MFRSVSVALADTAPGAAGDSTVRVLVRVSDAPRRRIRLGAGYGPIDCFRLQAGWTAYDFIGGAPPPGNPAETLKNRAGAPANGKVGAKSLPPPGRAPTPAPAP